MFTPEDAGKAMETATEPKAAVYLLKTIDEIREDASPAIKQATENTRAIVVDFVANKTGLAESDLATNIDEETSMAGQVNTAPCWIYAQALTKPVNVGAASNILAKALNEETKSQAIKIDYAVSRSGELKRAFSCNDKQLSQKGDSFCNDLLHNFLKEEGIRIDVNDRGSFLRDKNGKLLSPAEAAAVMARLAAHLEQKGVKATIKFHDPFPGETPVSKPAASASGPERVGIHPGEDEKPMPS